MKLKDLVFVRWSHFVSICLNPIDCWVDHVWLKDLTWGYLGWDRHVWLKDFIEDDIVWSKLYGCQLISFFHY